MMTGLLADKLIGDRVRRLRESHGILAKTMATSCGCDVATFNAGEKGQRRFSSLELYRIATELDVRLRDILAALEDAYATH
jgi:transcriptional regulator with XRE-family HTH domain